MDKKIQLGLYTGSTVPALFVDNVANMIIDLAYNDSLYIERPLQHIMSSRIDGSRNALIQNFLEETTASHLFIMDSDMKHPPMMPRMLLMRGKEIISGLYFHRNPQYHYPHFYRYVGEKEDARRGYRNDINWHFSPMIDEAYRFFSGLEKVPETDTPVCIVGQGGSLLEQAVVQIDGGGFGCLLLSREALEKLSPPYLQDEPGLNGDFTFYKKCKEAGIEVFGDFSCIATHTIDYNVSVGDFVQYLARNMKVDEDTTTPLIIARR